MTINAEDLRAEADRALFNQLLENPTVRRVNESLARADASGERSSLRRRLLATSVRLSQKMAPELHAMARSCSDKLGLGIELELYVFASPSYNAMCFKPEDGRLFVMFASSLIEAFEPAELNFVMGHELAHHAYRHHDIPIGFILGGSQQPDPRLALDLFTWSRYAEISADRAGAYCSGDLHPVAEALFQLASGLSGRTIRFELDDFLSQVDAMQAVDAEPGAGAPQEDWFSTHPFSPLRVRALQLFFESELMGGPRSRGDLEAAVSGIMSLMEPSYLEGRTESAETMRRLLFAAALLVANAHDGISQEEVALFEKFFGKHAYKESLNLEQLDQDLGDRIQAVKDIASLPQAMQVMRDLCLVARASGHVHEEERAVLDRVARGLGIPSEFVCQTLDRDLELD